MNWMWREREEKARVTPLFLTEQLEEQDFRFAERIRSLILDL